MFIIHTDTEDFCIHNESDMCPLKCGRSQTCMSCHLHPFYMFKVCAKKLIKFIHIFWAQCSLVYLWKKHNGNFVSPYDIYWNQHNVTVAKSVVSHCDIYSFVQMGLDVCFTFIVLEIYLWFCLVSVLQNYMNNEKFGDVLSYFVNKYFFVIYWQWYDDNILII